MMNSTGRGGNEVSRLICKWFATPAFGCGGESGFLLDFLRENVSKVKDLPSHMCWSPEKGDGSEPSLSFKRKLAEPQLHQCLCWALTHLPALQSNPVGDTHTAVTRKDRGSQQGAKRKEVKATASVRRYLMPPSLCCAVWGRSGMSRWHMHATFSSFGVCFLPSLGEPFSVLSAFALAESQAKVLCYEHRLY